MKVSIITPSFNQGQFIERTLQSVASQNALGFEVEHVVFDGGSTDNTIQILKHFRPMVRWISKKDNGQADAVNRGIQSTNGEIIGWLNSDDIYYPGAIARVAAYFTAHSEVDVVYGMADHIDLKDHAFEEYPTEPWNFERLKEICFICQPALFFRRRVVRKCGMLNESLNYCMDYEYWLRLGINGMCISYIEEKLAGSRIYRNNKTIRARTEVHKEINTMLRMLFGKVPDRWLLNYAHAVTKKRINRNKSPRSFFISLLAVSIIAALRWNGCVSGSMRTYFWKCLRTRNVVSERNKI